jgi:hypothetical protein
MRIVTRPDFDGVVCAVLLYEAETITDPTYWVEPNDMQKDRVEVHTGDIIANLPYNPNCSLWFDHHYTNRIDGPFLGVFQEAPSAARLVFDYYRGRFGKDYGDIVAAADKIDSADLTEDEVLHPERYDYILLSLTISNQIGPDIAYWNKLVDLFRNGDIRTVLADPEVQRRCRQAVEDNRHYRELLIRHTRLEGPVAVTDFRSLPGAPVGNRFLVYSLFPDAIVHVRIRFETGDNKKIVINVGHSIFNRNCRVNVGLLLSKYGGGGHPGAGSCRFCAGKADEYLPQIIGALVRNTPNDTMPTA